MQIKRAVIKYYIIITGIFLSISYWFIESFIHYLTSAYNHDFFTHLITMVDINELWMRISFSILLIGTGIIMNLLINRLRISESNSISAYQDLDVYKNLLIHDFRNIIQNINLSTDLIIENLKDGIINDELFEFLYLIQEQTVRSKLLISNILKLKKLGNIKKREDNEINENTINLKEVKINSIDFVKKSFPNRNISVQTNITDDKIFVQADVFLLDVFENILFNAVKHNRNENIEIQVETSNTVINDVNHVKVEFKDNGIGISDKQKKQIFQKDQKISVNSRGLGFGLSLVKKIITQYNGKIWIEDKIKGDYTKGSNFIITIPD